MIGWSARDSINRYLKGALAAETVSTQVEGSRIG